MDPPEIKHILHTMQNLPGITRYYILTKEDCQYIKTHEQPNNHGVLEAVSHQYCVCLVHDSEWREPTQRIVKQMEGKLIFPPVAFPEVPGKNVVSSSPGIDVHFYLATKVEIKNDEATLLIGFDL